MMVGSAPAAPRRSQRDAVSAPAGSQPEQAFARALREKGRVDEDADTGGDGDGNTGGNGDGGSQASAPNWPIAALVALTQPSPAPGCDGAEARPAGIEATGESAAAMALRSTLAPTAVDADSTAWEASVGDGSGFSIALRAEPAPPGPGEQVAWSVMIVSPALAREVLERQAPRLTGRLRRRGIGSRVRVDETLEDAANEST